MYKIQCLNNISPKGLALLQPPDYVLDDQAPDAILVRSHNLHDMAMPPTLKAIARAGVGTDNIPTARLKQQGIPVFNAPGANANAVKELTIAALLLGSRHLCQAYQATLKLAGDDIPKQAERLKKDFRGFELVGKTLGIVGLGAVGVAVANAAGALGIQVLAYDPMLTVDNAWRLSSQVSKAPNLEALCSQSDFISLHLPLTPDTKGLLHTENLKLLKEQALLLNFARNSIVNEKDLLDILSARPKMRYLTDFPDAPLLNHPQIVCLPHLGASTDEAEEQCAIMAIEHLKAYLETGTISHAVNFPSVSLGPLRGPRLMVVNRNIPAMVSQITATLGKAHLNIIEMINQSHEDIAYTVLDLAEPPKPAVCQAIANIDGVVNMRILDV